jgi:hypothetical protein
MVARSRNGVFNKATLISIGEKENDKDDEDRITLDGCTREEPDTYVGESKQNENVLQQ